MLNFSPISPRRWFALASLAIGALSLPLDIAAQERKPLPIRGPKSSLAKSGAAGVKPRLKPRLAGTTTQTGQSCTLIDFEGLGNEESIPTFQGISMPDWLSIIESGSGGTGNFSGESSPVTTAFWLYNDATHQVIDIPAGASSVSFDYAAGYDVTLSAYDSHGALVDAVAGGANFDYDTYVYDFWDPLSVKSTKGNDIFSVAVDGYANYVGIDDLKVCQIAAIDSVEITQAIQQYQTLDDLKASLTANGEPPVPIISGKPAVIRVYFEQVVDVTKVIVHLTGVDDQARSLQLLPTCSDTDQRARNKGCQSIDFYITPPSGTWVASLDLQDDSGTVLHNDTLTVTSRDTNSLRLVGVPVCDDTGGTGEWLCGDASALLSEAGLLKSIAPTNTVTVDVGTDNVEEKTVNYLNKIDSKWWPTIAEEVNSQYGYIFNPAADLLNKRYTTYFGQVRPTLAGTTGGESYKTPSHGAAGRTSQLRLGVETNDQVVAHETGHTLGLNHTGVSVPPPPAAPPGCYNPALTTVTNWPFATNNIQSAARLEWGFNVQTRTALDPNVTFDIMSYCVPRWISPINYKTMIATLGGGAVSSTSVAPPTKASASDPGPQASVSPKAAVSGPFWQVHGEIPVATVQFEPLFMVTAQGDTAQESGTYALIEENVSSSPVFTRLFTPTAPTTETSGSEVVGPLAFSQLIPVNAGVTALVVQDPHGVEIGRITLGGTAPTVSVVTPAAGFVGTGVKTVSWTIQNLVGGNSTSRVQFSTNGGAVWSNLAEVTNDTSLLVDFDKLPGSTTASIQVLVSDGVNTGSAISPAFTVLKKAPTLVHIDTPVTGAAQPAADKVYLSGTAYDPDDGVLSGSALKWTSDLQGPLGSGSPLNVNLQPGTHTLTLTATDSDAHAISTTRSIIIGGQPPVVTLQAVAVDTAPTTCETTTVNAQPGSNGAPIRQVQLSLDGGASYNTIARVPYTFTAPGSGFFHLVARAIDTSGQSSAKDVTFLTQSACATISKCDPNNDSVFDVKDVQQMMSEVLGASPPLNDVDGNGAVTVADIQLVINSVFTNSCLAQ